MTQLREPPVDEQSFVDWMQSALLPMTRLALRLAPDCDAHDVVQDAVERAWRSRSGYAPARGEPVAWLLAITATTTRDAQRRVSRRARLFRASPPVPEARMDAPDVDLERAVHALPYRQRLAVHCFTSSTYPWPKPQPSCAARSAR